ncbi:hypothetical protein [Nocardia sp. NPDC050406]|uniref:hypothetical protein n=1 Tax=Nocardia sp. NPDC050406 TaxID=3364318 RepID=UPI0037A01734
MTTLGDRLIAPGASRGEQLVCYLTATIGSLVAVTLAVRADLSALAIVVIAVVAFDLCGGAVVNATASAKRHFHREGRTARHHLLFVAIHLQPFLLALVVSEFPWYSAGAVYALALAGAVVVVSSPRFLQRPIAFAWVTLALLVPLDVPAALAWMPPILFIKLLLAHLQPDEAHRASG